HRKFWLNIMPSAKRISGNHGEWYMGLPASEPGTSRVAASVFKSNGDGGLRAPISPTGGANKAFSFVSGKCALIAPILEGLWPFDNVYAKSLKMTLRLIVRRMF